MKRFEDKVVLITGAASGIGLAAARRFAAEGAQLVLGDINDEALASAREEIVAEGGRAVSRPTDVGVWEDVEALTQLAPEHFGGLDVVFNNAAIGLLAKTPEIKPEEWLRVFEVDVHSVFYGCRAAIPLLRERGGGAIVNTASISGLAGDYGLSAYNAAKGAVVNYTKASAIEHARENIRINAVCPGPIETPLANSMIKHRNVVDEMSRAVPMGRPGRPEEVAAAATFLASDDASFMTGTMLVVDGGLLAWTGQPNFHGLIKGD